MVKLTFFVVNVGHMPYAHYTLPFIQSYCQKYNYDLHILNTVHGAIAPAWYKLLAPRIINADHIIACDLDIIPMPNAQPLNDYVHQHNISLCIDMCIAKSNKVYNRNFLYNTGLISVPASQYHNVLSVYDNFSTTPRVCWEQLFLNDYIAEHKLDIHVLDDTWNYMIRYDEVSQSPVYDTVNFKHLLAGKDHARRIMWAKQHYDYYYKNILLL